MVFGGQPFVAGSLNPFGIIVYILDQSFLLKKVFGLGYSWFPSPLLGKTWMFFSVETLNNEFFDIQGKHFCQS